MSKNLEGKLNKIRKSVQKYGSLDEVQKIDESAKIKKMMKDCKKTIINYLTLIDNTEAYLSESPDELNEEKKSDDNLKHYLTKIKTIEELIINPKLTIDERISLYMDLIKYTNYAKDYLDEKKEIEVDYV